MFKFDMNQEVNVKVLDVNTTGKIIGRKYIESAKGNSITYMVHWKGGDPRDYILPSEDQLLELN